MPMDPTQAALAAQILQGQSGMGQVPVGQIQQMDPRIQAIRQQMMRSMMEQSSPQNQMSGMGQIPVNELRGLNAPFTAPVGNAYGQPPYNTP